MKKYNLYKSWNLMTSEEQDVLRKEYKENLDYENDNGDEELFDERIADYLDDGFKDDFGEKYSNLSSSPLANQKVVVTGVLGLWNGKKKIKNQAFDSLAKAVARCLEDDNEIYEDQYGNLHIEAHHHDGVNHFIIKKATIKGLRCLHFRKEVFGA